jgi:hypothetical protein
MVGLLDLLDYVGPYSGVTVVGQNGKPSVKRDGQIGSQITVMRLQTRISPTNKPEECHTIGERYSHYDPCTSRPN